MLYWSDFMITLPDKFELFCNHIGQKTQELLNIRKLRRAFMHVTMIVSSSKFQQISAWSTLFL